MRVPDPNQFAPTSGSQFASDLQRAAGYKPVTMEDLAKGYAQYDETTKYVQQNKNATDSQLFSHAVDKVLAWWKKSKLPPAPKSEPAPRPGAGPSNGGAGNQGSGSAPRGGSSGGSSGSRAGSGAGSGAGGPTLPNTSISTGSGGSQNRPQALPTLRKPTQKATGGMFEGDPGQGKVAPRKPLPLTPAQQQSILKGMYAPSNWVGRAPAYALVSATAFRNWVIRAAKYAKISLTPPKPPVRKPTSYVPRVQKKPVSTTSAHIATQSPSGSFGRGGMIQ